MKLYRTISKYRKALAFSRVTKYTIPTFTDVGIVASEATVLYAYDEYCYYSMLANTMHEIWAWKNCSTMGGATLRYSPTDSFESFPLPIYNLGILESIGMNYQKLQQSLICKLQQGLTKTYNGFHAKEIHKNVLSSDLADLNKKEVEKQFGKETWNLWNHLQKSEGTCSWGEAVAGIKELRQLHMQMDNAVLEAYGWHHDSDKWGSAIQLRHNFYEVDYLPENDRVRFTIHPEARKEILKRLLLLNHERYEEEIHKGLHKKKDVEAFYQQKGNQIPEGITFSDAKKARQKQNRKRK